MDRAVLLPQEKIEEDDLGTTAKKPVPFCQGAFPRQKKVGQRMIGTGKAGRGADSETVSGKVRESYQGVPEDNVICGLEI